MSLVGSDSQLWDIVEIVKGCIDRELTSVPITLTSSLFYKFDLTAVPSGSYLVAVIPRREAHEKASRVHDDSEYDIQIAIMRKVDDAADADSIADEFFGYVETVKAFFREPERQGDGIAYKRLVHDPIYGDDHLKDFLQLTSIITLTITRITH